MVDKGHYVSGIFVDLEKAFDTVSHDILCRKLEFYGIRGNVNKLFQSYLSNRKQYVSIDGFNSDVKNVKCGVPQGSSLGPLLFLIYINDFRTCLNETGASHFADVHVLNASNALTVDCQALSRSEVPVVKVLWLLHSLSLETQ